MKFTLKSTGIRRLVLLGCLALPAVAAPPAVGQDRSPARDRIASSLELRLLVQTAVVQLVGAYRNNEFILRITEFPTHDLSRSLYVEMTRTDDPLEILWRQIWSLHIRDGELIVRVGEFSPDTNFGEIFTGAWAAPESFPPVTRNRLYAVGDLRAEFGRNSLRLAPETPFPTMRRGAHLLDMEVAVRGARLEWWTPGLDSAGAPAWGAEAMTLHEFKDEVAHTEHENGLITIDLRTGEGDIEAKLGDDILIGYTGYVMTGHSFFSTRWPGQELVSTPLPAEFMEGWNLAVLGMKPGGVRRAIIPPWLGYGLKPRGMIPPNSWLIFDLELMEINRPAPGDNPRDPADSP